MSKTSCAIFVVILFVRLTSWAQTGTIKGLVTEKIGGNSMPIAFANILISGSSKGTVTDIDGNYELISESGIHDLIVSFIGYETDTVKNVIVRPNEETLINVSLTSSSVKMEEVMVVSKANRESQSMLNIDRKESTSLVQNIGAQELSKKASSNVADGLKKVVGLTVVGSKFVYVRGMGDRYNSAYLNGMPIPSPDPDNRVIPLNIFPTNIVRNLSVTKSFNPELYGDFSGGAIDIKTKEYPEEKTLEVNFGTSLNTQSSFKKFYSYNGGKSDFFGIDDGTRATPKKIGGNNYASSSDKGSGFKSNFNPKTLNAPTNSSFGILAGNKYELSENIVLGVIGTLNFSNNYGYQYGQLKRLNKQNVEELNYNFDSYNYGTSTSSLGSANLQLFKNHQLAYTLLFSNLSNDQFKNVSGNHFDYPDQIYSRRFTYRENQLMSHQIRGEHSFLEKNRLKLDWTISINNAGSKEPDRRQLVYLFDPNTKIFRFNHKDVVENHRFFNELEEEENSYKAQLKYGVLYKDENEDPILSVRLGVQHKAKSRTFESRIFTYRLQQLNKTFPNGIDINNPDYYLSEENFNSGLFSINEATGVEANHKASLEVNAGYLSFDYDLVPEILKIVPALRFESSSQSILYRKQGDPENVAPRKSIIDKNYALPSLTIKYISSEKSSLNFSGSKTISRPGFKELAPFEYTEVFAGTKNRGNPNLKNGENINLDLRFEIYPNGGELMAIGVFGKQLQNPIEKIQLASASGQLQSFQNSKVAHLAGVEFELSKNLGVLVQKESSILKNLNLNFNASYIYSKVEIDTDKKENSDLSSIVLTNTERPLQGASPYIINLDLNYEKWFSNKFKGSVTAAYNIFGKRVNSAGAQGLGDVYEMPVNSLNLKLSGEINNKLKISITAKNLLDPTIRLEQETDNKPIVVNSFKRGIGIGLGISYSIF